MRVRRRRGRQRPRRFQSGRKQRPDSHSLARRGAVCARARGSSADCDADAGSRATIGVCGTANSGPWCASTSVRRRTRPSTGRTRPPGGTHPRSRRRRRIRSRRPRHRCPVPRQRRRRRDRKDARHRPAAGGVTRPFFAPPSAAPSRVRPCADSVYAGGRECSSLARSRSSLRTVVRHSNTMTAAMSKCIAASHNG
jgi:hypothetical protein